MPVGSSFDHNHECHLRLADHSYSLDMEEELTRPETVGHSNYIPYFGLMAAWSIGSIDPSLLLELGGRCCNIVAPEAGDRFLVHNHIGVAAVAMEVVVQLETNCW